MPKAPKQGSQKRRAARFQPAHLAHVVAQPGANDGDVAGHEDEMCDDDMTEEKPKDILEQVKRNPFRKLVLNSLFTPLGMLLKNPPRQTAQFSLASK